MEDLVLHFQRKKVAQRHSRISQSMGGRELKPALRAPAYNTSNSGGAQQCSSCLDEARNPAIHRYLNADPLEKRYEIVSKSFNSTEKHVVSFPE